VCRQAGHYARILPESGYNLATALRKRHVIKEIDGHAGLGGS
jgi:hypothetical protein